jgi:group I intron endonuclease
VTDVKPCYLYLVTHRESGKSYVGISVNPTDRWRAHLSCSKHGRGAHFANALRLYGKEAFDWKVIQKYRNVQAAQTAEKLAVLWGLGHYNLTTGGEYGKQCSPEVRAKMSVVKKGRTLSAQTRAKMSVAQQARNERLGRAKLVFYGPRLPRVYPVGHTHSEQHRANISAANRGVPKPPRTAEHIAKISAAKTGKKYGPRAPYMTAKRKALLAELLHSNPSLQIEGIA